MKPQSEERKQRLAAALRQNLRRRKAAKSVMHDAPAKREVSGRPASHRTVADTAEDDANRATETD